MKHTVAVTLAALSIGCAQANSPLQLRACHGSKIRHLIEANLPALVQMPPSTPVRILRLAPGEQWRNGFTCAVAVQWPSDMREEGFFGIRRGVRGGWRVTWQHLTYVPPGASLRVP